MSKQFYFKQFADSFPLKSPRLFLVFWPIIIIIIIIYLLKFFTSELADGLSLEFKCQ